jgi:hypothetical protein
MRLSNACRAIALMTALISSAANAGAQATISRAVVASGGGASSNGTITVISTIGQPVIGRIGSATPAPAAVDFGFWSTAAPALAAPQLTSVAPTSGSTSGGAVVTLNGFAFTAGATVTFDGLPASVVGGNANLLTVVTPPHAAGVVAITVTTAAGVTTIPTAYTYITPPAPANPDDTDGDGLSDACEVRFGLDALQYTDPAADPDGDGKTNLQECEAGTHPRGFYKLYFAEGAANAFFAMRLALLNPGVLPATAVEELFDPAGALTTHALTVGAHSRATTEVNALADVPATFSTIIESDQPLVADRSMTWDGTGYGNHSGRGVSTPASSWYFAEGATAGPFSLFYLFVNPAETPVDATVTYLRANGLPPIVKTYTLPAHSRTTINVDGEDEALRAAEVAASIQSTAPIVVERAMYANAGQAEQPFAAGAVSPGQAVPRTAWYFAEGATGFFDLYLLLANPGNVDAEVDVTYLLPDGTMLTKRHAVAAQQRVSIAVVNEDELLRAATLSMTVASANSVPIVAERTMWWPSGRVPMDSGAAGNIWYEGHIVPGSPETGTLWALADAETGGSRGARSYVLILNTSADAGTASMTLLFEDGTSVSKPLELPGHARTTVSVSELFPEAIGRRFGVLVESTGATPARLVVERATYWDAPEQFWGSGDAQTATRLH